MYPIQPRLYAITWKFIETPDSLSMLSCNLTNLPHCQIVQYLT